MILKDRSWTVSLVSLVAECLKLSYETTHHIISDVLGYSKVAHAGCQECWLLESRISACKLLVVISTCTWQILSSFFIDISPWIGPVLTISIQKRYDKICSKSTQRHLQWSSFDRPHRLQSYGVRISEQRRSSDDWLLVARPDRHSCIVRWISPQTAWRGQKSAEES